MESFKEDLRKWTNEEIESQPGRLAAQIVLNRLIKNDFQMWFVGNVDGNQLYTVTLSNEEKAIVSFTDEILQAITLIGHILFAKLERALALK